MIGEKIFNYEITALLGKGGMGTVYRATDTMLGRDVALKMLHPQLTVQPQFLDRFKKEARVLAQLLHINIAVIYNFLEQNNNHFMVMEFVEGTNLEDLMKKYGSLPPQFVVPVFVQALEGLNHAHKKNIFHRDIKPANLMLTPEGTVKLMDFGIAKIAGEQKMTQVNKIIGTIEYMAPELIQGKDASAASDIYAMGLTLYEVLTGKLPFENDTDYNLMQAILNKKINPPDKVALNNAAIPKALSDIVMKAIDKKPENRFSDARAFQQALIRAFPQYTEINMVTLDSNTSQSNSPATRLDDTLATLQATRQMANDQQQTVTALESFKEGYKQNKKFYLTLLAVLLVLLISIAIFKPKNNNAGIQSSSDTSQSKNNDKIDVSSNSSTEIIQPPIKNNDGDNGDKGGGGGSGGSLGGAGSIVIPGNENENTGNDNSTNKPSKKKEPVKVKEEKKKPTPVVVKEEEDVKPAPAKDIYIGSKVEVELYLQENLANSPERTDIPVTFTVKSPVYYNGVIIVSRGSVARGIIKLGRVQTDVDINTVHAVNGQQLRLKAQRGHGRRNEITSNRNYTAIILPGVRLKM